MKLLICDDQNSVHTFLMRAIDWKSLGIDSILHAYSGKECLDVLNTGRPDLLLLDIKLPNMTGIDILKELSQNALQPLAIILSAYGEFSYAKDSLKYGAFDYELKPIDADRLTSILEKAVAHQKKQYYSILAKYLNGASYLYDNVCVIMSHLLESSYACILISPEGDYSFDQYLQFEEQIHTKFTHVLELNDMAYFVLYPAARTESMKQSLQQVCFSLISPDNPSMCFYVSQVGTGPDFLSTGLKQCRDAAFSGCSAESPVFFYREKKDNDFSLEVAISKYEHHIQALLSGNCSEAQFIVFFKDAVSLLSSMNINQNRIKEFCSHIIFYNLSLYRNIDESVLSVRSGIYSATSLSELVEIVITCMTKYFFQQSDGHNPASLQDVRHYLLSHYSENITLEKLSKKFFISKYTLCRNFHHEYNESLWEFLKRIRMEEAHRLLSTTRLKIYEIATQCGYTDSNYFSNTYKKYFGHTPQEDRPD